MNSRRLLVLVFLSFLGLLAAPLAAASETIGGVWTGTLAAPQGDLSLIFHIDSAEDGSLTATLDSPDQGAFGIPVDEASFEDGKIVLKLAAIGGGFEGTLLDDGATLQGSWSQGGGSLPLELKRQKAVGNEPTTDSASSATASDGAIEPTGFLSEFLAIDQVYGTKMTDLAKAIPEEKYDWRPAEGVRSIGEAIMHIAQANFFAVQSLGVPLPDGLPDDYASVPGKDRVVELLEQSFALARKASLNMAGLDLSQPANIGGQQTTIRGAILGHVEHHGEHLGQLIAYARSVGVVPPWSR